MLLIFSLILFYLLSHPLALGLNILFQTALISLIIGLNSPSFWLSYVLFLVFMGGILVLTIYVVSLANSEIISINFKNLLWGLPVFLFIFINLSSLNTFNFRIIPFMGFSKSMAPDSSIIIKSLANLYSSTNFIIILFLAGYLFYILVIIRHIININEGPLRSAI